LAAPWKGRHGHAQSSSTTHIAAAERYEVLNDYTGPTRNNATYLHQESSLTELATLPPTLLLFPLCPPYLPTHMYRLHEFVLQLSLEAANSGTPLARDGTAVGCYKALCRTVVHVGWRVCGVHAGAGALVRERCARHPQAMTDGVDTSQGGRKVFTGGTKSWRPTMVAEGTVHMWTVC
jgi:hypothetical protein